MYFRIGFTRNRNICVFHLVHKIVEDLTKLSLYLGNKYLYSGDINTFYTIFRAYIVDGHIHKWSLQEKFCSRGDAQQMPRILLMFSPSSNSLSHRPSLCSFVWNQNKTR